MWKSFSLLAEGGEAGLGNFGTRKDHVRTACGPGQGPWISHFSDPSCPTSFLFLSVQIVLPSSSLHVSWHRSARVHCEGGDLKPMGPSLLSLRSGPVPGGPPDEREKAARARGPRRGLGLGGHMNPPPLASFLLVPQIGALSPLLPPDSLVFQKVFTGSRERATRGRRSCKAARLHRNRRQEIGFSSAWFFSGPCLSRPTPRGARSIAAFGYLQALSPRSRSRCFSPVATPDGLRAKFVRGRSFEAPLGQISGLRVYLAVSTPVPFPSCSEITGRGPTRVRQRLREPKASFTSLRIHPKMR